MKTQGASDAMQMAHYKLTIIIIIIIIVVGFFELSSFCFWSNKVLFCSAFFW